MKHRIRMFLFVAATAGCNPLEPRELADVPPPPPPPPAPARASAAPEPPEPRDALVGVVTTKKSAVVAAEFEARVTRILVTSGQRVRAGDPLVQLDDSQLRQRVEAARHNEEAARGRRLAQGVAAASARRRLNIERDLYERGAQSREAVNTARFEVGSSQAAAASATAEYQAAVAARVELEQQLARATLLAPIDGIVGSISVEEGEIARSGTRIARVFDPRELRLLFEVPRERRGDVKLGAVVEARTPALTMRARVAEVSADLEPPLQFAIATAEVIDGGTGDPATGAAEHPQTIAEQVGAEVRVTLADTAR